MNSRRLVTYFTGLVLAVAFAAAAFTTSPARAAAERAHPRRVLVVTSSGRVINLLKPPSGLKPNTLVRPLNSISPDEDFGNFQICDPNEQCINNWGKGGLGNLLRWYNYAEGEANNEWNWWYEGTVSGPQEWPFTPDTGINTAYDGDVVFKFAVAPGGKGTGNCMSQQLFTPGDNGSQVNTDSCACSTCQTQSGAKLQYFVLDGAARLVAVHATDDWIVTSGSNNNRVWVGVDTTDANGKYIYLVTDRNFAVTGFAGTT